MLTKEKARSLVVAWLGGPRTYPDGVPLEFIVLDEHTIERQWGFIFFYSSKRYRDKHELRYMLFGNAPLLVDKRTGQVHPTGTAQPVEHYIAEYERKLSLSTTS
jgi:hypothetical protein